MKIAIIISGRAVRYEVCLLPFLEKCPSEYDIDLFMSINDEDCEYYRVMTQRLSKYLKRVYIKKYSLPSEFKYTHPKTYNFQKINGEYLPYNILSMFWNDRNAFQMAIEYSEEINTPYDLYMKFRSDITETSMPELMNVNDDIQLFSIFPICFFTSNGLYPIDIISDAWVWGNKKSMTIYCDAYSYILQKNKELNGNYFICFESSNTDNVYENKVPYFYVRHSYRLDANRRIFDKPFERDVNGTIIGGDIRQGQLAMSHNYVDPKTVTTTENIPVIPII